MAKDYYKILEVHYTASPEIIEKAKKVLLLRYHPDRNLGREEWAKQKTQEILEAYSVLSDPKKRAEYDKKIIKPGSRDRSRDSSQRSVNAGDLRAREVELERKRRELLEKELELLAREEELKRVMEEVRFQRRTAREGDWLSDLGEAAKDVYYGTIHRILRDMFR
ncbi:MAG: DnaJ domain-containing protein [bacterium]